MQERASLIGAAFEVSSRPGATCVRLDLPPVSDPAAAEMVRHAPDLLLTTENTACPRPDQHQHLLIRGRSGVSTGRWRRVEPPAVASVDHRLAEISRCPTRSAVSADNSTRRKSPHRTAAAGAGDFSAPPRRRRGRHHRRPGRRPAAVRFGPGRVGRGRDLGPGGLPPQRIGRGPWDGHDARPGWPPAPHPGCPLHGSRAPSISGSSTLLADLGIDKQPPRPTFPTLSPPPSPPTSRIDLEAPHLKAEGPSPPRLGSYDLPECPIRALTCVGRSGTASACRHQYSCKWMRGLRRSPRRWTGPVRTPPWLCWTRAG